MEPIYVLKRNKIIKGPFSFENLKIKGLKESDKIWFKGLSDWMYAKEVQELNEIPRVQQNTAPNTILGKIFAFLN